MSLNGTDSTAAIMREKAKVNDKVVSAVLNATSENRSAKSDSDNTDSDEAPNDAEVSFLFSVEAIHVYLRPVRNNRKLGHDISSLISSSRHRRERSSGFEP